jgi:hypothetical protein
MFDRIDGHRSIAEILDQAEGEGVWSPAQVFFEKLWWYDQVVFDMSMARQKAGDRRQYEGRLENNLSGRI